MLNKSLIGAAVVGILASSLTAGAAAGKFKCEGGNACKGQGGCANPKMAKKHASAECKGHSFVMTKDEAACTELKTKMSEPAAPAAEAPKG